MRCSNCKTENPPGKKFCGDCGAALANLCPKCGADNPAGKRFCGECGTVLGALAAATSGRPMSATRTTTAASIALVPPLWQILDEIFTDEERALSTRKQRQRIEQIGTRPSLKWVERGASLPANQPLLL